uniref:Putative secreted protein n=1 Tax=Rhipicephalus microplus TaxID=6941 RepID=A0A6M2DER2_RHIMP
MRSTNPLLLFIYCMALNCLDRQYSQHCYFRTSGNVDELLLQCSICTSTPEFILHHFCLPSTLNRSTSVRKRNMWG